MRHCIIGAAFVASLVGLLYLVVTAQYSVKAGISPANWKRTTAAILFCSGASVALVAAIVAREK
jgi:hypothetical protein